MKRIKRLLLCGKGSSFIDASVIVIVVVAVIALLVAVVPVINKKTSLDYFANELIREAEVTGRVGAGTAARAEELEPVDTK